MKVLGIKGEKWSRSYICDVSHDEIRKHLNRYHGSEKLEGLHVGAEVDLAKGYDFLSQIKFALRQNEEFLKAHSKVIATVTDGMLTFSDVVKDVDNVPQMLAALESVRSAYSALVGPDDPIAQTILAEVDDAIANASAPTSNN